MGVRHRVFSFSSWTAGGPIMPAVWLGLAVLLGASLPARAGDLSRLYAKKSPSVVTITQNGRAAGTGFFVADHLIATCYHVIRDANHLGYAQQYSNGIQPIKRVAALDTKHDLALVYTETAGPPVQIILPNSLVPGMELATIGSPLGFEKSIVPGTFNNLRDDGKTEYLQVSNPASPGSSGSPLFTPTGQVVGIMQLAVKPQYGQNLNFAISSKYLLALLDQAKATPPAAYAPVHQGRGTGQHPAGKNFGAYYAWIDKQGVYCFTATPPPAKDLYRMLTPKEVQESPVSYMRSTPKQGRTALPGRTAATP